MKVYSSLFFFIIAKTWEPSRCTSTRNWKKVRCIYTIEYPTITRTNTDRYYNLSQPQKIMLRERSLTQESLNYVVRLLWSSRAGKSNLWWGAIRLGIAFGAMETRIAWKGAQENFHGRWQWSAQWQGDTGVRIQQIKISAFQYVNFISQKNCKWVFNSS